MKTFFLSLAGAFCAMILFIFLGILIIGALIGSASASDPQPDNMVLTLDLRAGFTDQAPTTGLAALSSSTGFIDILTKLKGAETDPNVKGLFVRASQGGIGSSRAEELRDAFNEFRAAGKFIVAHSQGTFSTGPSGLRAIAAADEIWIQPGTDIVTSGISFETIFQKDFLDLLSITPEVEALYEYKNAPNSQKENDFTDAHREAMTRLGESLWEASLDDIAADRNLDKEQLRGWLEAAPIPAEDLVDLKIMDKLGWPEEAKDAARDRDGKGSLWSLNKYQPPFAGLDALQIAVIGGEGAIVTGRGSSSNPFANDSLMGSDTIASAILRAGKNKKVKALLFRVESPGGSPTASDQIWKAIEQVQEDGKPVVISMGSVAASGGYYVSTGADYIMASRSTITGSIGIYGGKTTVSEGLERLGIHPRSITVGGEFAHAYGTDLFTENQRARVRESLTRGYERFTGLVADGRGMTQEEVHEIARGRVWSGEDALERGLVDEIGGFTDAVNKAAELAGIEEDQAVRLVHYPKQATGIEALNELFGVSADVARAASVVAIIAGDERVNAALGQLNISNSERTHVRAPVIIEN